MAAEAPSCHQWITAVVLVSAVHVVNADGNADCFAAFQSIQQGYGQALVAGLNSIIGSDSNVRECLFILFWV